MVADLPPAHLSTFYPAADRSPFLTRPELNKVEQEIAAKETVLNASELMACFTQDPEAIAPLIHEITAKRAALEVQTAKLNFLATRADINADALFAVAQQGATRALHDALPQTPASCVVATVISQTMHEIFQKREKPSSFPRPPRHPGPPQQGELLATAGEDKKRPSTHLERLAAQNPTSHSLG